MCACVAWHRCFAQHSFARDGYLAAPLKALVDNVVQAVGGLDMEAYSAAAREVDMQRSHREAERLQASLAGQLSHGSRGAGGGSSSVGRATSAGALDAAPAGAAQGIDGAQVVAAAFTAGLHSDAPGCLAGRGVCMCACEANVVAHTVPLPTEPGASIVTLRRWVESSLSRRHCLAVTPASHGLVMPCAVM